MTFCILLAASSLYAQMGQERRGRGFGVGTGPIGRGPGSGWRFDRSASPANNPNHDNQPVPVPALNRPGTNPQGPQMIPPAIRRWLQNGGWAILRQRLTERAQLGFGPRTGNSPQEMLGQGQGPRMGSRGKGTGRPDMGMGMGGQGLGSRIRGGMLNRPQVQPEQPICPCCRNNLPWACPQSGMRQQGLMRDPGRFGRIGPMAGIGGVGRMRRLQRSHEGGPNRDQWQQPSAGRPDNPLKVRPGIRSSDGFKGRPDKDEIFTAKPNKERRKDKE